MEKSKRTKKSNFYKVRWNVVGINESIAAQVLGESIEVIKQWDISGAPELAEKYLLLWDNKRFHGREWSGWCFSRGRLIYKRQMYSPQSIINDRKFRESLENETAGLMKLLRNSNG